ncbi:MAG: RNA methyltransferase [Candidatus Hydrogenedentes bacterium]|nr:RNA methyltransferase [Candidatus Hydrogenedentota bacterium]MBI3117338.1 RNA methyltransferase [Candidatus Hydrogenedentota bacterium]
MSNLEPHYAKMPLHERPLLVRQPLHVVLDNIRSAFNVGSIFRTADAGAIEHLYLCGMSACPPHKKLEKTALGAFEYVPWTYFERTGDCIKALQEQRIPVVAIEVTERAVPFPAFAWPRPVAVVFGNEVTGIHERHLVRCDAVVQIPMHGHKNSINVASAFGIILYDVLRRWEAL